MVKPVKEDASEILMPGWGVKGRPPFIFFSDTDGVVSILTVKFGKKNPIVSFYSTVQGEIGSAGTLLQPVGIGCTTAGPHFVQCADLMGRS